MKNKICVIMSLLVSLTLAGCGMVEGKGEAEKVAESLFQERMNNGWVNTDQYYSELFFKSTTTQKWSNIQDLVTKAMGELKGYALKNWKVQSKVHTSEMSGTIVILVYETSYENGNGMESITVHRPLKGDKYSILGHNINSELIQQLIDKGIQQAVSQDKI